MDKVALLAFSEQGYALAEKLAAALGGEAARSGQPDNLKEWTEKHFADSDGLIYVGACGIAVRAIAPYVQDKTKDPAVVVIDERALHVIPILSGHLGGANDLARRIAGITGSDPVITTATDVNGVFAVDEWAKRQNCALLEKERIVKISGKLLAGGEVAVASAWEISGEPPEGVRPAGANADVTVDIRRRADDALHLVPRICVLGVGCRKGTTAEVLEERFTAFLAETGICAEAICAAATIDLKKEEPGLLDFVKKHEWPLEIYTAGELAEVAGDFTPSAMVEKVTGVDNVCERSAVRAAGGELIARKFAGGGVTFALAAKKFEPNWNWRI